MRERRAAIQKEYMIARRLIEDAYSEFAPEDLPVDFQRVKKDLAITRDRLSDQATDEIERKFKITIEFLRIAADQYPSVYEKVMRKLVGPKFEKIDSLEVSKSGTPGVVHGLPEWVSRSLSVDKILLIIETLARSKKGVLMIDLFAVASAREPLSKTRVRSFVAFLKTSGHLSLKGKTRNAKYFPTSSLSVLRTKISVEYVSKDEE